MTLHLPMDDQQQLSRVSVRPWHQALTELPSSSLPLMEEAGTGIPMGSATRSDGGVVVLEWNGLT